MYTLLDNVTKFCAGNVKILLDLFDKMMLPVCTYNCKDCGASFFSTKFSSSSLLLEKQRNNTVSKIPEIIFETYSCLHSTSSNLTV